MEHTHRIFFLSHGGGPMPLLGDPGHTEMVACLTRVAASMEKPAAILLVSAHWEEDVPTITSAAAPPLIYDYGGFPPEAYQIQYPCPGFPALAQEVHQVLTAAGLPARLDSDRGFDHGLFVPLKIMYPDADIPCVQLSLARSLDPALHIAMGRALRKLEHENLLIVGSGFTFHNMQAFFASRTPESIRANQDFERWLVTTMTDSDMDEAAREQQLLAWEQAPHARYCHPREEHLLPLHVCYGAASTPCPQSFELTILQQKTSMYLW